MTVDPDDELTKTNAAHLKMNNSNDSDNLNLTTISSISQSSASKNTFNCSQLLTNPSLTLSPNGGPRVKTKQFKTKSNNIKSPLSMGAQYGSSPTGQHPLKPVGLKGGKAHKLRWLANMRSDPDLKDTLTKSVKIRPSSAIPIAASTAPSQVKSPSSHENLLSIDYYSNLCDKQLSFESPCRSPGTHMAAAAMVTSRMANETTSSIVVAKQIECSDKIGFNVKPVATSIVATTTNENSLCNRILSHFKKSDNPNDQPTDLNVTHACLSPAAVPRVNRCTPFSFREIRLELQSVIKSQSQKSPQQQQK
jgi:hypothetical protein